MEPRLQRRVQRYGWDKACAYYERYWQAQLEPAQRCLLEMAALQPGERVLDVACGTGLVTFRAAEAVGAGGHVLATDISEEMVKTGRELANQRGLTQVAFERMDAENLKVPDAEFDAALCSLGLMYVPEPVDALTEMKRALKPGGRAVAAVWGERKNCGWAEIFPIVDSRVESEVCPLFFLLGGEAELEKTFEDAGFADIETERLSVILEYSSDEDACGAAFEGGPVALAYSRFDEKTTQEARSEYLATIEVFRRGGGFEIPGEFVVTRGRKNPL